MNSRALLAYLVPRRRRLSNGLVLVSRNRDYLLELLVVVGLVASLAGVAIKSYRPVVDKVKLIEAASVSRGVGTEVLLEYAVTGSLPDEITTTDTVRRPAARFYETVRWADNEIVFELKPDVIAADELAVQENPVEPMSLSYRLAFTDQGRAVFLCGLADSPAGFSGPESQHTTVPARFLPFPCRG